MSKIKNRAGKVIGGILLVAGVAAVFLYKAKPSAPVTDDVVRPIKSEIAGETAALPRFYFPGTIEAESEVDLSFEVAGRIIEFPIRRGQAVHKGALLARLDPANYENNVKNAEADLERAKSSLERVERALKSNAVSQEEFSQARAAAKKAEAQLETAKKALSDTSLVAAFDGWVSDTYADNFDTVPAGRPVLKLQDISRLVMAVSVPETYLHGPSKNKPMDIVPSVRFDTLGKQTFPAMVKEYATVADPVTQTYRVRFSFENPDSHILLPGMSGTVVIELKPDKKALDDSAGLITVASSAVGFADDGGAFVWVLENEEGGVFEAHRRSVTVAERTGVRIVVADGLKRGERVATAGVMMLTEGRRVSLLDKKASSELEPAQ